MECKIEGVCYVLESSIDSWNPEGAARRHRKRELRPIWAQAETEGASAEGALLIQVGR